MPSEEIQRIADAINETSSLITKLGNLQHLLADFDRLRLAGANFLGPEAEEYQEYWADAEAIQALSIGPAGEALATEMPDSPTLRKLRIEQSADLNDNELRSLQATLDRAIAKAEAKMRKLLTS